MFGLETSTEVEQMKKRMQEYETTEITEAYNDDERKKKQRKSAQMNDDMDMDLENNETTKVVDKKRDFDINLKRKRFNPHNAADSFIPQKAGARGVDGEKEVVYGNPAPILNKVYNNM